jgi:hypothetical protein
MKGEKGNFIAIKFKFKMNIFKKLFSGKVSSFETEMAEQNALMNENNFLNDDIKFDFYEKLLQITLKSADKNNPAYPRLFDAVNKANYALIEYFGKVLKSGLSQESLDTFCNKHEEILNNKYEFPVINGLLSTYWYQIIKKLLEETRKSDNVELKQRFEPCYIKLEQVSRKVFGI